MQLCSFFACFQFIYYVIYLLRNLVVLLVEMPSMSHDTFLMLTLDFFLLYISIIYFCGTNIKSYKYLIFLHAKFYLHSDI